MKRITMKVPTLLMIVPEHFSKYRMAVITNVPIVLFQEHEEFQEAILWKISLNKHWKLPREGLRKLY